MTPFLLQTARFYHSQGNLHRKCFIFPNKRALAFFKKYLGEEVRESGIPAIAPQMLTMNDFFYRVAGKKPADKVHLLLRLYDCYRTLNPKAEPLDDFIFWGDVLLADFDDIDKYLVDAGHIFTNVAQFKGMQDSFSYLTQTQEEAVRRFLSHFEKEGRIKTEFRKIWDLLLPLYSSFREALDSEGLSYEGQVYRQIAERLKEESAPDVLNEHFPDTDLFVFTGLNALNECEKSLMRKTSRAGMAEFCWDYSGAMIRDPHNKASFFLSGFIEEFRPAFEPEDSQELPRFSAISVPSAVGQAKLLPSILNGIASEGRVPGIDTAIILPDESMLMPVLDSIPASVRELNVTMGYPMAGSSLWSLMNDIAALQLHIREKDGKTYFYHRQVRSILSNSLVKGLLDEDGKTKASEIRKAAKYYIPAEDLCGQALFDLVFHPAGEDSAGIGEYLQNLITGMASRMRDNENLALELDFAKDLYQAVGRLLNYDLPVKPATYYRLLAQIVAGYAVPFRGEPLKGLQIMGPLETRALDFENVIILNCNEGIFPRHSVSPSFVPPELRKAFGLPTYEYQDAVWAYYFYRLVRRAGTVTMLYDSRTEISKSGEESRYIKQLEMHFGVPVEHFVAKAPVRQGEEASCIEKTAADIEELHRHRLSASALQSYLICPAKFYYHSVLGLKAEEEVNESLDSGMLGTVFHSVMEDLYRGREFISSKYLKEMIADRELIRELVRRRIMKELNTFEVTGRNIIFEDMVCRYVTRVLRRDLELLGKYGVPSFRILGLELECHKKIGGFDFVGYIDRLDSFAPGEVRVVDYKTGRVTDDDFIIDEENAEAVVSALFGERNDKRPKIALQLYLYDTFVRGFGEARGKQIVNSIYQTSRLFVKDVENVALNARFCDLMKGELERTLKEIEDTGTPWLRKGDENACGYCDFKKICGR